MAKTKEIKKGFHLKYIPSGRMNDLIELANKFKNIKNKDIALCKFIECFSSIVERSKNNKNGFVPVQQAKLKRMLKMDNGTADLLKALVKADFLELDKSNYVCEEHSYEYKPIYTTLDAIAVFKNGLRKQTDAMLHGEVVSDYFITDKKTNRQIRRKQPAEVYKYADVIQKLTFSDTVYPYLNQLSNQYHYDCMLKDIISKGYYVRCNNDIVLSNLECDISYNDSFVPKLKKLKMYDSFVPDKFTYIILGKIPTNIIPALKLLGGRYRVSRPNQLSRIYTNITNLGRNFRYHLLLNGKHLSGFNVGNSQPLIGSIIFKAYSIDKYGCIKDDVVQYQRDCENKVFYEYFMQKLNIDTKDPDVRTKFKADFFGGVYYTMITDKENELKSLFKDRYPTCYEAMHLVKGGRNFSKKYKDFPTLMQEFEAQIIVGANMELIEMGYDVVNIFDSILATDEAVIEKANEIVLRNFAQFGITPTLCQVDYRPKKKAIAGDFVHQLDETIDAHSCKGYNPPQQKPTWDEFRRLPELFFMSEREKKAEYTNRYVEIL